MERSSTIASASLASILLAVFAAVPSQAQMVAGWDFSQYAAATLLTLDGVTYVNTLDANYSDLDPTFGAGAESAALGTMFIDGTGGSTNVNPDPTTDPPFIPTSDSLLSNFDAPGVAGEFDQHSVLLGEGQLLANPLSMIARGPLSVVFAADLSSVPETGGNWSVSFGARAFSGTSTVDIQFSTDGSGYSSFGSVQLTEADTPYAVDLGSAPSETAFVRLSFNPVGIEQPILDNVAIHVPEPGAGVLGVAALLGLRALAALRRRRA